MIADLALIILAVIVVGWRRVGRRRQRDARCPRVYPVAGLLAAALASGLAGRTLLVHGAPEPDLAAVMPLVALDRAGARDQHCGVVASLAAVGKAVAVVLIVGWLQAAVRG